MKPATVKKLKAEERKAAAEVERQKNMLHLRRKRIARLLPPKLLKHVDKMTRQAFDLGAAWQRKAGLYLFAIARSTHKGGKRNSRDKNGETANLLQAYMRSTLDPKKFEGVEDTARRQVVSPRTVWRRIRGKKI